MKSPVENLSISPAILGCLCAILITPNLSWGQTCNDAGQVMQNPVGPYKPGDIVRITFEFGAGTLQNVPNLTVNPAPAPAVRRHRWRQ